MARVKDKHWKPKDIFLLPNTFKNGDSYPNKGHQKALETGGYGSCNVEGGLDRSWTIDQLVDEVRGQFPRHEAELAKTGIEFAQITPNSKKINVHVLVKGDTVADLEKSHGSGILVILQKARNASLKTVPKQSKSTPHVKLEIKSPKKPQSQIRIKSEPTSHNAPLNQVQYELDILAQSGGIKIAHLNCQSLCNKKDELKLLLLCRTDIDVMTLSETFMRPNDSNGSFSVPGYTILARKDGVSKDSGRPRGGVLTYVKVSLARSARKCSVDLEEGLEAVCVDVELDDDGPSKRLTDQANSGACVKKALLRIVNVYVPPGTRGQIVLLKKLQRSMDILRGADKCCKPTSSRGICDKKHSCSCKTSYVILGDFNCDRKTLAECKVMGSVMGEKVQTLDELESSHHLTQLIKGFTRVDLRKERGRDTYKKTESLIDLVYTDDTASVIASGVVHIGMSDHFMVYCAWGRDRKKGLRKATRFPTQDAAFRQFSTKVNSDIDRRVYDLIRDRDSAIAREDWDEYERLKDDIKIAKKNNKKDQKQNEKAMKTK
ncbi:uncharacterized protein LOC100887867 [Strongylocentrotus purpuratus]|uniref:Endonuclease/exonuclease/phosphatase domain-containing protein n=1 Tax=Strongylocentrotus purpuratus TaxID=7668 RepID=A0A7M7GQM7_STRPU|nr:uncharacterized protein LOC100887867 [Strongylocentrotus purpuratus]